VDEAEERTVRRRAINGFFSFFPRRNPKEEEEGSK